MPPPHPTTGAVVPANMMQYNYNVYEAVQPHWFFCRHVESKSVWLPFSIIDSIQLEETYNSGEKTRPHMLVVEQRLGPALWSLFQVDQCITECIGGCQYS